VTAAFPPPLPIRLPANSESLVLVVEDDPANRVLVTRILELEGYRVVSVSDGEAAIRSVAEHRPVLVRGSS
jgi:CheY-like chemotaxis protein